MKNICRLAVVVGLCLVAGLRAESRTKLIDWSWSNPDINYLEKNLPRMNEECPFLSGLVLRISGDTVEVDGKKWTPQTGNAWNKRQWRFELFQNTIERFKKLDFGHFTDNFFYMTTSSVDFDWLNDEDCAAMAANFGVAAQVAKAIGLKGLGVDIEEYGRHFWRLSDMKTTLNEAEVAEIVFKRGQQWGRAVFSAYPDIILLMPFCLTMNVPLELPFMNGVIDVMPPTAMIYEGCESSGYAAKVPTDYSDMQMNVRRKIGQVIRPENVNKARGQIRLAPAFYLDAYFNDKADTNYYVKNLEPGRSERGPVKFLMRNLVAASMEAEPYIWVYGEQACWWKNSWHPRAKRTWEEMPEGTGVIQAITELMKAPTDKSVTVPDNLLKDATFKGDPKVWNLWQVEQDQKKPVPGDGGVKDGRGVMHKVTRGCLVQTIPIKPGQIYFYLCRGGVNDGRGGAAHAAVCFKNADNKWLPNSGNISLDIPQTGKTETVSTYFITPKTAAFASVQCGVRDQVEGGEAFFTEILLEEK